MAGEERVSFDLAIARSVQFALSLHGAPAVVGGIFDPLVFDPTVFDCGDGTLTVSVPFSVCQRVSIPEER